MIWDILKLFDLPDPRKVSIRPEDIPELLSPSQMHPSEYYKVVEHCRTVMLPLFPELETSDPSSNFHFRHSTLASWACCLIILRRREGSQSGSSFPSSLYDSWIYQPTLTSMLLDAYMDESYDTRPESLRDLNPIFDLHLRLDLRTSKGFPLRWNPAVIVDRILIMCQIPQYLDLDLAANSLLLFIEWVSHWERWVVCLVKADGHIPLMRYLWKTERRGYSRRDPLAAFRTFKLKIVLAFVVNLHRFDNQSHQISAGSCIAWDQRRSASHIL